MDEVFVLDLDDAGEAGADAVGVKGWSLAQLRAHDLPTPAGFVLSTDLYRRSVADGGIAQRLRTIWESARTASPLQLQQLARTSRHLISALRIDAATVRDIVARIDAYGDRAEFAVRASAVADGVTGPACAGVHATFSNVIGAEAVISRMQGCWASLYGERALAMRARGLGSVEPSMAVVIQPMLRAEKSGIAVPMPSSSDVLVEATFGLGEPLVSGAVEPDRYVVDSSTGTIRSISVGRKQIVLPGDTQGRHAFAPLERQRQRALNDAEVAEIGGLCARVSASFGSDHEIEWLIDSSGSAVLQARAIDLGHQLAEVSLSGVIAGIGIGPGSATGHVRLVDSTADLASVSTGDVLVARATVPEWRPHLLRVAAIVTESGDEHSHAAHVATEFGIPAVVGATSATSALGEGTMVTVDAVHGRIFPSPAAASGRGGDTTRPID